MSLKRVSYWLLVGLLATIVLAACGETATPAPSATSAITTNAATTVAANTSASAATTNAAATSAAATTSAATTNAATTANATTSAAATTTAAATSDQQVDALGIEPFQKFGDLPPGSKKGGNINIVSLTKQLTADMHPYPQNVSFTDSWTDVATYIFGTSLLDYDASTLLWRYGAAQKLEISTDLKTYTFTLRDGLKFSDGSPITTDDYAYGIEQASHEDKINPDNNFVGIDTLQKFESYTASGNIITCKLKVVVPKNLALSYCGAVSPIKKSLWTQYPFYDNQKNPEILKPTVTSGAYKLKTFKLDEQIVLEVNPNYYRGVAGLETLTFVPSSQPTNAYESVKAGQNQYAVHISPSQYADAKTNPNVNLYDWASANDGFRSIDFNLARAPFSDKAMRQAVAYAIDRAALLKAADNNLGLVADSFISPNNPIFYNPNVTKYPYDLTKARQVLKDAGYTTDGTTLKDKTGKAVEFTIVYPTSSNPRKLQATYLQQQLKQLGVKVNVDGEEFNAYIAKITNSDFDMSLNNSGGGIPADPDGIKSQFKSKDKGGTQNRRGYSNPRIDELFDKGSTEPNDSKRVEYYKEIQQIISDDLPTYYLYALTDQSVTTKNLLGPKPLLLDKLYVDESMAHWALSN